MSWLGKAALRLWRRLPRRSGTPQLHTRASEEPPRDRQRDGSPRKVRRDALICPPTFQKQWPYQLPPQTPPPPERPPRRPPPAPTPRFPPTRLQFVRGFGSSAGNRPPPPRSPCDEPQIDCLCPMNEAVAGEKVPGPGDKACPKAACSTAPPLPPPSEGAGGSPAAPEAVDTDCSEPLMAETMGGGGGASSSVGAVAPQQGGCEEGQNRPLFSCAPPIEEKGPCAPELLEPCCPPPETAPTLLKRLAQLLWWGGRATLAASLVYWSHVFGLWGDSDRSSAIVDQLRTATGVPDNAGSGVKYGLARIWDTGVKTVFSAVAAVVQFLVGPGMGTGQMPPRRNKPLSQVATVEMAEENPLAPCGCCRQKSGGGDEFDEDDE